MIVICIEKCFEISNFQELAFIQHGNAVACVFGTSEVVRDNQRAGVVLMLNVVDELCDFSARDWIQA